MIWAHKAKLHWVCRDVDGIESEVQVVRGISYWALIDIETGEIIHHGKTDHPLTAMKMIQYITHSKNFKGESYESVY